MMADLNDVQLSTEDILKKQFKTKVKGLDPAEVDAFLDKVITDYDTFEQIIEDLYGQIGKLQGELMDSQHHEETVQMQRTKKIVPVDSAKAVKTYAPDQHDSLASMTQDSALKSESSTNMAIIQRISTLERKVYNLEQRVYGLQKQ